ncbi:MAG: glutaminase [Chthoniobacter sp.]|jgi:glutaminase|nr:glutaminase [Chthoniobacter sp.]
MKNQPNCSWMSPILDRLEELHRELAGATEGDVATYIPELAKADPRWFGICLVTANGAVYETGDSRQPFTIQSISKPFVYGLALEDRGRSEVLAKIGVEPTGDAFNSISLDPRTGRPRNPMINAGAIAATGLIEGKTSQIRLKRMLAMFELYAGRELLVDDAVYQSESETGHRNRAIGHMLRNFGILTDDPIPVVETYFRQCAVSVTCHDLAVMAATLANRGTNPITGEQAIRGEYVESVLAVMGTCGMYDYAGEWLYNVGMPAKSGVSGGVIAVLPGQLGIGVFSPPLDPQGNSVRGIGVCNALSRHWDLHLFNRSSVGNTAIRLKSTAAEFNSKRVRSALETNVLRTSGACISLYQLQGNLTFATAEVVVRNLGENADAIESLILDFKRVMTANESACRLFHDVVCKFAAVGRAVVFTHLDSITPFKRYMKGRLGSRFEELFQVFDDNDAALEWCEDRLLARILPGLPGGEAVGPREYELFSGLPPGDVETIVALLDRRTYQAGETIINAGDEANELFLLASGSVSVILTLASGRPRRLATFSAGMSFGEMAIIDRAPRSAMIIADSPVVCDRLPLEAFAALDVTHPGIKIKLLDNVSRGLSRKLRKANRELAVFE